MKPTFTNKTFAIWESISIEEFDNLKEKGHSHHMSESKSEYFEINIDGEDFVFRKSNHWHANVNGCGWFLDGKIISRSCAGKVRLSDFLEYNTECLNDSRLSDNSKRAINHYLNEVRHA